MLKTTENCNITQNNYIDGTIIINKSGIENIGYGSLDKLCLCKDTFSKNRRFF